MISLCRPHPMPPDRAAGFVVTRRIKGVRRLSGHPRKVGGTMATATTSIDPTNPAPLYAQVEAVLASDIADGALPAGAQLPCEDRLIERFGVSRPTVRRAVQNLAGRGLVEIQRGKGTFVTRPKITQELTALTGFVEDMQALGRRPT